MINLVNIFKFLKIILVVGVSFSLFSCKMAKLVFYEHLPSKSFYENYNLSSPVLNAYFDDEVLFVISTKAIRNRTEYIVWQGLYTKFSDKKVKIKKAMLSGNDLSEAVSLNQIISLNEEFEKANLLKGSVKLFQIKASSLEEVGKNDDSVFLKVFYEIDGREGVMNYELKRRIERQNVYPT